MTMSLSYITSLSNLAFFISAYLDDIAELDGEEFGRLEIDGWTRLAVTAKKKKL